MINKGKHHYIPRFYIKGFINKNGKVWVYDKKIDKVKRAPVGPGGIFFEWGRNNLVDKLITDSSIETIWYHFLDDYCKDVIKDFQSKPNVENLHNYDNLSKIQFFLIHLFWRLPKTDFAFDYLIENADFHFKDKDSATLHADQALKIKLQNDKNYKKVGKLRLPSLIINELNNYKLPQKFQSKLIEEYNDIVLLGDYPMVFRREPASFEELLNADCILPISSKRVYITSQKGGLKFGFSKVTTLNTLIINQAVRYVCGPDKDFLEKSVEYYKKRLAFLPLSFLKEEVFDFNS